MNSQNRPHNMIEARLRSLRRGFLSTVVPPACRITELRSFVENVTVVSAEFKFDLRGWVCSDHNLENYTTTAMLGLTCDKADTLAVGNLRTLKAEVFERRNISLTQRVFDPIGFTCPISLSPKLLLQKF